MLKSDAQQLGEACRLRPTACEQHQPSPDSAALTLTLLPNLLITPLHGLDCCLGVLALQGPPRGGCPPLACLKTLHLPAPVPTVL